MRVNLEPPQITEKPEIVKVTIEDSEVHTRVSKEIDTTKDVEAPPIKSVSAKSCLEQGKDSVKNHSY